jgi:lipopolysaccharide/colanic/teichoic acid biosynthesis glycosyltransferase
VPSVIERRRELSEETPVAHVDGTTTSKGRYKRPFDLSILVASHVLLAPIFLFLWVVVPLLVWLEDRGPVFYGQNRKGKDGRIFTVLKFRTMVKDAERRGPVWTTEGDPRVTRVGKLLRRTALDELPELTSIWKGDMSFVGPRALDASEHEMLEGQIAGFEKRLRVSPGLTGLAQVYDREDAGEAKLQYDLDYISRMNPFLDMKLMLLSVRNTLLGKWDRRRGKAGRPV